MRILGIKVFFYKKYFYFSSGGNTCAIPIKSLVSAGRVLQGATDGSPSNVEFLLLSNRIRKINFKYLRGIYLMAIEVCIVQYVLKES